MFDRINFFWFVTILLIPRSSTENIDFKIWPKGIMLNISIFLLVLPLNILFPCFSYFSKLTETLSSLGPGDCIMSPYFFLLLLLQRAMEVFQTNHQCVTAIWSWVTDSWKRGRILKSISWLWQISHLKHWSHFILMRNSKWRQLFTAAEIMVGFSIFWKSSSQDITNRLIIMTVLIPVFDHNSHEV